MAASNSAPTITLTETYHNVGFLNKLAALGHGRAIRESDITSAKKINKRLKGRSMASAVTYEQLLYKINNNDSMRI